jgi:uncharacterized protein YidB (DUF937 family)
MSKLPNLTALLGLVAIAGYQNRDKIASFVQGLKTGGPAAASPAAAGGTLSSSAVTGGLTDLVTQLSKGGLGAAATSWVGTGANQPVTTAQLEQALGPDILNAITAKTGVPADQILQQLSAVLPQVVDHLTPAGKLPAQ